MLDSNLLVYSHVPEMPQHGAARAWLEEQFSEGRRIGLPWPTILSFLRLVTNPRIFREPEGIVEAWGSIETWLEHPQVWIPLATERHAERLAKMLPYATEPNLVPDAHLAALALEHGLTLCSADADFARFPELRWENPLR